MATPNIDHPLSEAALRNMAANLDDVVLDASRDKSMRLMVHGEVRPQCGLLDLFQTAHAPSLSQIHRVKAYDVLCSYLEICLRSHDATVTGLVDPQYACDSLVALYLDRHDSLKTKHNKRLLNVLVTLLQKCTECSLFDYIMGSTLSKLDDILFVDFDQANARPALHILALFLTKDLLQASSIARRRALEENTTASTANLEQVITDLTHWACRQDTAQAAGSFLTAFLDSVRRDQEDRLSLDLPIWAKAITFSIVSNKYELNALKNHLFPRLFNRNQMHYWLFAQYLEQKLVHDGSKQDSDVTKSILFTVLQVGVENGLADVVPTHPNMPPENSGKPDGDSSSKPRPLIGLAYVDSLVHIPNVTIDHLMLAHNSFHSRNAGLSLLVSSNKRTKPLLLQTITCLRRHIPHLFADVDAGFRSEVLKLMQDLLRRIRNILVLLSNSENQVTNQQSVNQERRTYHSKARTSEMIKEHVEFITWLHSFILYGLHPSSNYQRHITSLRTLLLLAKCGVDKTIIPEDASNKRAHNPSWPIHIMLFPSKALRLLSDLLLDPFDDVRQFAASLLHLASPVRRSGQAVSPNSNDVTNDTMSYVKSFSYVRRHDEETNVRFLKEIAETKMLRSGRADHADGVARIYGLMMSQATDKANQAQHSLQIWGIHANYTGHYFKTPSEVTVNILNILRQSLVIARSDIEKAVESYPLHGYFISLRYSLEVLTRASLNNIGFAEEMCSCLEQISQIVHDCWHCVNPVLCNDAPEGYIFEDSQEDASIGTKDILSWAWRALKESSLLIRDVLFFIDAIQKLGDFNKHDNIHVLVRLGDLTFTQLAELRHRGAFSTVAQTFSSMCSFCQASKDTVLRERVNIWYDGAFSLITKKGNSITRRSAGIPSIIAGLLSASAAAETLDKTFKTLKSIALNPAASSEITEADLPQVHAMNSLRAIFTTNKLALKTDGVIIPAIEVAGQCLSSEVWSIRNAGLMLFRSLIDRLLGSFELNNLSNEYTSKSSRLSYKRYPGILDMMQSILKSSLERLDRAATEGLFPVLDLLRRKPPSGPERQVFQRIILRAAGSPQWHVRTMAARAFASLGEADTALQQSLEIIFRDGNLSHNVVHGRLLCAYHCCKLWLMQTNSVQLKWVCSTLGLLQRALETIVDQSVCPAPFSTAMEVLNLIGNFLALRSNSTLTANLRDFVEPMRMFIDVCQVIQRLIAPLRGSCLAGGHVLDREMLQNEVYYDLIRRDLPRKELTETIDSESTTCLANRMCATNSRVAAHVIREMSLKIPYMSHSMCVFLIKTLDKSFQFSNDAVIRGSILEALVTAANHPKVSTEVFGELLPVFRRVPIDLPPWEQKSPSTLESSIRIAGFVIAAKYIEASDNEKSQLNEYMEIWIKSVQASINERNDFSLRYSAAKSLRGLTKILHDNKHCVKLSLPNQHELIFTTYDALNDDDEDVRVVAAESTPMLLRLYGMSCPIDNPVPLIAQQMLTKALVKFRNGSSSIVEEVLRRLKGDGSADAASTQLADALQEDEALFVVEKQNLYIDPLREAWVWSRVLKHLGHCSIRKRKTRAFVKWVLSGLACLKAQTANSRDGPLGWTSRPEVFAFGMRIIYAAEVLLHWRSHGLTEINLRASGLRKHLMEWLDAGMARDLHPLWMEGIEKVLVRSVEHRLHQTAKVLKQLPIRIC